MKYEVLKDYINEERDIVRHIDDLKRMRLRTLDHMFFGPDDCKEDAIREHDECTKAIKDLERRLRIVRGYIRKHRKDNDVTRNAKVVCYLDAYELDMDKLMKGEIHCIKF